MKDCKALSRQAFDQQAASYDTTAYGRHARTLYPLLLAQLGQFPCGSILDAGCGTGALLAQILERIPDAVCAGVDLSEGMLAQAKARLGTRAELVLGDAEQLPFRDARFDVVLCCDSFHHYPDPAAAIQEFHRVLRPGGAVLLADCSAPPLLRAILNQLLPLNHEGDVRLYSAKELHALLARRFGGVMCRRAGFNALLAQGVRA